MFDRAGGGIVPQDRSRRWVLVSAAIHVAVIAGLWTLKQAPGPVITLIDLDDGADRTATMPAYEPPPRAVSRAAPTPARPSAAPSVVSVPREVPTEIVVQSPDSLPIDPHGAIEPRFGDGRLWVRVSDIEKGILPARREAEKLPSHVALVDSALAEKIKSYMDTVPPDSFATRDAPKWTTTIAGQPWGLDGKWIYLGPIKLPAAILALLPLPAGNYELAQRNMQLQRMREDIMQAAARATNAAEFKKYVKELRARKDLEHQQRIKPDTAKKEPLIP